MKTGTMDIPFELQHLKQILEFSEALFPSPSQAGYHVNCVLNGSWVHCGEVIKAMWSGGLSGKCIAVLYVSGIRNCTETKPKLETDNSSEHPVVYCYKFQG